jgi:hypothetical protein
MTTMTSFRMNLLRISIKRKMHLKKRKDQSVKNELKRKMKERALGNEPVSVMMIAQTKLEKRIKKKSEKVAGKTGLRRLHSKKIHRHREFKIKLLRICRIWKVKILTEC